MNSYRADGGLDAARQDAIERLTQAFSTDAIGMEEYERRASEASAATTVPELERLTFDLPAPARPAARPKAEPYAGRTPSRTRDASLVGRPSLTTGCVMGDRVLNGNWLSSDRVSSFTVMGSTRLDFSEVDLPPGPIKLEVFTLMGETKIFVPPDLPVRLDAFVFMGESKAGREVNQRTAGAETWLEISGFSMMGSVTVHSA